MENTEIVKDANINIRVSKDLKKEMQQQARLHNMSLTSYIMMLYSLSKKK